MIGQAHEWTEQDEELRVIPYAIILRVLFSSFIENWLCVNQRALFAPCISRAQVIVNSTAYLYNSNYLH